MTEITENLKKEILKEAKTFGAEDLISDCPMDC